jgi:hypothetical protein
MRPRCRLLARLVARNVDLAMVAANRKDVDKSARAQTNAVVHTIALGR